MRALKVFLPVRSLFSYWVCLTSGDHVFEEEGEVHQPDAEAHRHLSSHGPAAAPGQLCGASWSPARGPICECQECVWTCGDTISSPWEGLRSGHLVQEAPAAQPQALHLVPQHRLFLSILLSCSSPVSSKVRRFRLPPAHGPLFSPALSLTQAPTQTREPMLSKVWAPNPSGTVRKLQVEAGVHLSMWSVDTTLCWERPCSRPWEEQHVQPRGQASACCG